MRRLDVDTVKKIREMLSKGKTYDEIEKLFGVSRRTIADIAKMSDEEFKMYVSKKERKRKKREEVEEEEEEEEEDKGKGRGKDLRRKALQNQIKEVIDRIADESLENLRDLISYGLILRSSYENFKMERINRIISESLKEKLKNRVFFYLLLRYMRNEIDRDEFLKRVLVIRYA